jgi:hypothetical protein
MHILSAETPRICGHPGQDLALTSALDASFLVAEDLLSQLILSR